MDHVETVFPVWKQDFSVFNGNKDFGKNCYIHGHSLKKKTCFKKQIKVLYLSKVCKLSLTCNLPIIITPCAEMFKKLLHGHGLTVYEPECCLFLNRMSGSKQVIGQNHCMQGIRKTREN